MTQILTAPNSLVENPDTIFYNLVSNLSQILFMQQSHF